MAHRFEDPSSIVCGIADHVFDRPLALTRSGINLLLRFADVTAQPTRAGNGLDYPADPADNPDIDEYGIATISIHGALLKSESPLTRLFNIETYEGITRQLTNALANPDVSGIVLDIESPGGESAGCADLADLIYRSRTLKPIYSCSNDSMFSAAYWLGSSASRVYVSRDGGCGSIGVYCVHLDRSGMDEQFGLRFSYVFAGDRKIDGNQHEPLTHTARDAMQAEVNRVYGQFLTAVSRNRAGIPASRFAATQGQLYFADACLPILADRVGSLSDCKDALMAACGIKARVNPGSNRGLIRSLSSTPATTAITTPSITSMTPSSITEIEARALNRLQCSPPHGYEIGLPSTGGENPIPAVRRSGAPTNMGNSRLISMLVAPYNVASVDLGGGVFEIYARGCFNSGGLDDDPCVFWNHDERLILGRASVNAKFYDTLVGVRVDVTLPDNVSFADDLLELLRAGLITSSSAAFWILKSHWISRDGKRYRVIDQALMREAAPVSIPAYRSATAMVQPADTLQQPLTPAAVASLQLAATRIRLMKLRAGS
jgi:HK97 family phage prohead protease